MNSELNITNNGKISSNHKVRMNKYFHVELYTQKNVLKFMYRGNGKRHEKLQNRQTRQKIFLCGDCRLKCNSKKQMTRKNY